MFESYQSYRHFAHSVSRDFRLHRTEEQHRFLEELKSTVQGKEDSLSMGKIVFRAQLGHDWRDEDIGGGVTELFEVPHKADRMHPLPDKAREGRANPKGIPCFYAATQQETSIAEVRPWIGSYVSVGWFRILRNLRVVNLRTESREREVIRFEEPDPETRTKCVWEDIDVAFSCPVEPTDDLADYAPTQLLAEFFRSEGFDGIAYKSSLGPGHNLAIFDLSALLLTSCQLMKIEAVDFKFREWTNPYFVRHTEALESELGQ